VYGEVEWHLADVAEVLRREPAPLPPDLLRVVLHGLADLCRVIYERGGEAPASPPSLFRDTPVVTEALAIWKDRIRAAMTANSRTSAT